MTVAIVSGEALGLFHSSASQLGTTGTGFGAAGDQLYVNANTGNLVIQRQDQVVKGHGVDASVVRTYNSQGNLNDSIGGQYFNFQQHVVAPGVVNTAPKVRVTADGYEQSFTYVSANHYVSEEGAGAHDTLNYENGNWVYTEGSSGLRETYENANNGQLLTRTDREGYGQRFEYDTSGRLQYIIDEGKQVTRLSYEDSSTRVSKLENYRVEDTDNPGSPLSNSTASLIQYAYYEDGRLKRVTVDLTPYKQEASDTDRLKNTYTTLYAYDGASSRISSIHQGVGNTPENAAALFFVYDGVGRITELRMGEGDEARITRFAYQKDLNDPTGQSDYTEVTDLLDYRREGDTYIPVQTATTRYRYDANGQLTKVEPPADEFGRQQVTSYTYTDHGDVRQIRDGDNHTVRYHYDYDETDVTSNDGLRLWQMDNDGNAIRWIYNDNQQVAAEISYQGADVNTLDDTFAPTGAEVTRFIYNTKGQLRFTLSPKDSEGKARVQETRYEDIDDTQRRIIRSYQYLTTYTVPSAWDLTLDQISTPDSTYRAALEAWVDFAPQANSAQMTETHLDFRGQVSQVRKSVTQIAIDNTGAANDTIGSETRIQYFIYNEYGRLIQQIDGKTIADSGPYETSETLASLVGYSVGDGQTLFVYDGLGRLIATALATNNSDDHSATNSLDIGSELGNTNALIEEDRINANTLASRFNSVTHYGVNTDGQQQVTTLYANGLTQTQTYNSAGELLSSVRFDSSKEEISPEDANFGETTYRYDDAGRLRMVIDPEGVRSHTLYDDGGKLIATVDGSGALTEYSYDNSGNQTRTIGYANYLNVTQLNRLATQQGSELVLLSPSLSSIRPSFSPDDRIVHSLYDEANQLAYQIDGEGYVTEYQYDGAGRLTNTIEHGTPYLGYDYVSSDGVAISAPDYDALKAFSQYNYSAEGSYSLSQGAWEQGIRHETDATILTHSISSIADNLSGLVVSDAYNDLYLDHGISLDHILADTSQVDTWIQRPIKQLVGKATWQANFSEAGNLPVYYGFTGIDAQSVGRVSSTEAQPYFTVENGQLKLTPKNIAYGKDFWWNNSEQVQFSGARQYDTRETFEFSYTFSETDSLSSNKDILLGMSDENNQTLGFSLEGSEIRLSDEAGTDGIYKFPIVRQQGATYRLHMIRENGIITATVYQVDTDAGTETELAQKVLSAEEQYEWGEGLHSVIELWGKTSGSILIHDIQETGHAFELPYDVKINVDNAGDIVPVYGQLHNEITDFSQPQEKTNWGFISEGEVNNLGEPGYTVNEAQETDGLMFSHNQGKLSVRSITTASEGKAVRLVSNQTYHRNAALPLTFRWEISGGTNSNYSRAFFGFRDEDNNTGGVKLVRDDAFVATGVKGKDVGALPANRDRDATQVIELVIIGSRALVYYYPKGSTERQLFDTHEVFDTSNYVTPFIEVWGDTNTNYNKAAITVESFQVIGLTEWDATLAVEDTETIQHIGGRSLQGVYTNDISTLEKLEARLVRSDVLNQISGTNYTEEWVETYLDIGTYDGRLDVFDGEVLGAGEYHIEVRTTTTGDAAPGPATFLENADGSLYTYTEQYRLQENPYGQGATLKHYFTTQNSDDPNYLNLDLYNRIETQLTNIDTGETTVSVTNIDYPEQYSGYVLLDQSAPLDTGLYEITIIKHGPGALQSAGDIQETFTSQVGVSQTYTHTIGVPVDDFYNLDNTQALTLTYWKNDSGRTHSGINQTPETLTLTLNTQTQRYETSISNLVAGQYGYQIQYTQLDETELATLQGELRGDNSTGNDALLTSQHRYINHQTEETGEGLHLSNYLTLATRESGDGLSDVERTGITHLSATVRYADSTQVVTQAITDIDGWNLTANESSFAAHSGQLMLSQGQALSAGKYQVDVAATLANGDVIALNSVDFSVSNRLSADGSAVKDTNTARLMWDDQNAEVTTFRYQEEGSDEYTTITIHNTDGDVAPEATMRTYKEANNGDWVVNDIGPKITGGLTGVDRLTVDALVSTVVSSEVNEELQNSGLRYGSVEPVYRSETYTGSVDVGTLVNESGTFQYAQLNLPYLTYQETFSGANSTFEGVDSDFVNQNNDGLLLTGAHDGSWQGISDTEYMQGTSADSGPEPTTEFTFNTGFLQYDGFVGMENRAVNGVDGGDVFGLRIHPGGVLSMVHGNLESPAFSQLLNGISLSANQEYTVRVKVLAPNHGVIDIIDAEQNNVTSFTHTMSANATLHWRNTVQVSTQEGGMPDGLQLTNISKTGAHFLSDAATKKDNYHLQYRKVGDTEWKASTLPASFNDKGVGFYLMADINEFLPDTDYEIQLLTQEKVHDDANTPLIYEEEVGYGRFTTTPGNDNAFEFNVKQFTGELRDTPAVAFDIALAPSEWNTIASIYVEVFEQEGIFFATEKDLVGTAMTRASLDPNYDGYMNLPTGVDYNGGKYNIKTSYLYKNGGRVTQTYVNVSINEAYPRATQALEFTVPNKAPDSTINVLARRVGSDDEYQAVDVSEQNGTYQVQLTGAVDSEWEYVISEQQGDVVVSATTGTLMIGKKSGLSLQLTNPRIQSSSPYDFFSIDSVTVSVEKDGVITPIENDFVHTVRHDGSLYISDELGLEPGTYTISGEYNLSSGSTMAVFFGADFATSIEYQVGAEQKGESVEIDALDIDDTYSFTFDNPVEDKPEFIIELSKAIDRNSITLSNLNDSRYAYGIEYSDAAGNLYGQSDGSFVVSHLATPTAADLQRFYGFSEDVAVTAESGIQQVQPDISERLGYLPGVSYVGNTVVGSVDFKAMTDDFRIGTNVAMALSDTGVPTFTLGVPRSDMEFLTYGGSTADLIGAYSGQILPNTIADGTKAVYLIDTTYGDNYQLEFKQQSLVTVTGGAIPFLLELDTFIPGDGLVDSSAIERMNIGKLSLSGSFFGLFGQQVLMPTTYEAGTNSIIVSGDRYRNSRFDLWVAEYSVDLVKTDSIASPILDENGEYILEVDVNGKYQDLFTKWDMNLRSVKQKIVRYNTGDWVDFNINRDELPAGYEIGNVSYWDGDTEKPAEVTLVSFKPERNVMNSTTGEVAFVEPEVKAHYKIRMSNLSSREGDSLKYQFFLRKVATGELVTNGPVTVQLDGEPITISVQAEVTKYNYESTQGQAVIQLPDSLLADVDNYQTVSVNIYNENDYNDNKNDLTTPLPIRAAIETEVGDIIGWAGANYAVQIGAELDPGFYIVEYEIVKKDGFVISWSAPQLLAVGNVARPKQVNTLTWPADNIPEDSTAYIRYQLSGTELSAQPWVLADALINTQGNYQIDFGDPLAEGSYDFELLYVDNTSNKELSSAIGSFAVDYTSGDLQSTEVQFTRSVTGRETRTLYDINGTLQAAVSAEGAVTEFVYNGLGQLVHTIAYGRSVDDVALHISGSLTDILNYVRDETAAPDAPETLHSYQFYNQAGQTIATVDAAGYVSVNDIDSFGRVVASKRFANAIDPTSADGFYQNLTSNHGIGISLTDLAAHLGNDSTLPDDQITQARYNDRGWVERTIDAQGVRTNLDYNALGQRIATHSGLNADGTSALDDASRTHSQTLNANGQVREETVGDQQLKHHYDNNGLLTSTEILSDESDHGKRETRFFYDANGRLVFSLNANNELEEIRYNAFGDAIGTQVYAERLHDERFDLDGIQGGIASAALLQYLRGFRTDSDSRNHLRYDRRGQLRAQVDANGNRMNVEYNAFGEKARDIRTAQGGLINDKDIITEYTRDLVGRIISTSKDALGLAQSNSVQYDTFGRVKTAQDGNGNISSYEYDALGRQVAFNATVDGTSETLATTTYDAFGRILTQTDAENTKTTYQYNDSDRSITITVGITSTQSGVSETTWTNRHGETRLVQNSLGEQTRYEYDLQGQLIGVYRNDDADVLNRYYESGLLEETEDATGHVVRYEYDASSRLIRQTVNPDNNPAVTEYQYNAKGQQIQEKRWLTASNAVNPDFILSTTEYDSKGQVSTITVEGDTDKDDVTTAFSYDDQGRQLTISTGGHGGIGYETNDEGQLVRVYSAPLHQVRYEYDSLGRRISETVDPDVHDSIDGNLLYRGLDITTTYRYDDNNNVIQVIDANGALTTQYYDELNRNTISVNALGEINEQTYDLKGNMIASRVRAEAVQVFGLSGGYNTDEVMSRLSSTTHPDDQLTQFVFNERNQLKYVIDAEGGVTESIYDSVGRVIESVKHDVALIENGKVYNVAADVNSDVRINAVNSQIASAGTLTEKFWIDNAEGNKYFGKALAASDDFMVLGASADDEMGVNAGAVNVYKREGDQWIKDQKLFASDGYLFGHTVAIDGNRIVVGTLGDGASVYVFERNLEGWDQKAKLVPEGVVGADNSFDSAVAISGDTIIVGAYQDDTLGVNTGAAYVFELKGGVWLQETKLIVSGANEQDGFGRSVAINGDNIAVGAYWTDQKGTSSGSVYAYKRGESGWEFGATLVPDELASYDYFGSSVAMSNDRIVVGAHYANSQGLLNTGAAYVYVQNSGVWVIEDILMATNLEANALFGTSVAISGERIVVGAIGDGESGASYVFGLDEGNWAEGFRFENAGARADSQFGTAVALSGDALIVGAYMDDKGEFNDDQGSVSVISLNRPNRTSHTLYNSLGQAQYVIDPLGHVSENVFDRSGRLLRTVEYAQSYSGANTFDAIDTWSMNLRDSDINNRHTWTVYNSLGQAETSIDGEGWVTQNEYDLAGRVTVQRTFRDALDISPYVTNGVLDQTAVLDWATQQVKQWQDNVNAAAEGAAFNTDTFEALRETRTVFDNAGRIVAITDALGETETFTYDQAGNRTGMTNKLGHHWTYLYDAANRLVREVSPEVEQTRVQGEVWSQDFTENEDGLTGTALTQTGGTTLNTAEGTLTLNSNVPGYTGTEPLTLMTDEDRPSHYQWQVEFSIGGASTIPRNAFIGIKGKDSAGEPRSIGLNLSVVTSNPLSFAPKVEYQGSGAAESTTQTDLDMAAGQEIGVAGLMVDARYTLGFVVTDGEMTLMLYKAAGEELVLVGSYTAEGNWDDFGTNKARSHLEITNGAYNTNTANGYSLTIHNIQQLVEGDGWAEWAANNTTQTVTGSIYTDYQYDAMGNRIQLIEAAGTNEERVTDVGYDRLGRQLMTWHNTVGTYEESYDTFSNTKYTTSIRQEIIERPTERTWYDFFGNEVAHRNQLGDYSFRLYDDSNRLSYEIDAEGYVTGYTYNALGDQVDLTRYAQQIQLPTGQEPEGNYTLTDLDVIQPLLTSSGEFAVLNGESLFALAPRNDRFTLSHSRFVAWINSQPNMVNNADNRGLITTYNDLGQRLRVTESSVYSVRTVGDTLVGTEQQAETHFAYNRWGEVIDEWTLDGADTEIHQFAFYDQAGRQVATINAESYLTTFEYDADNRLLERTEYAQALSANWQTWTTLSDIGANALTQQTATSASVAIDNPIGFDRTVAYRYDALGRQTQEIHRNVIVDQQQITTDPEQSEKRSVSYSRVFEEAVVQKTQEYDAVGNVIRNLDATGAATLSYYDALGRVIAVIEPTRLSEVFDTSERLTLVHRDKGLDTARLEWNTAAIAGATAVFEVKAVVSDVNANADWIALDITSDGYTSSVDLKALNTDQYEYRVTYQRDGETDSYGDATGVVDIITDRRDDTDNVVSWVDTNEGVATVYTNALPSGAKVMVNGLEVSTFTFTDDNATNGSRAYVVSNLVRGQHTVEITDATGTTLYSSVNFQILESDTVTSNFAILNSTYDATVEIQSQQWYDYTKKKWRGDNEFTIDYKDLNQLGNGDVTWSIDVEFYNALGKARVKTYTSNGPRPTPGGGSGYIKITSTKERLTFVSESDKSSKGRNVILTRVVGVRLYKEVGGSQIKVIDSAGNARVERVEFLNMPATADVAELRYRPAGTTSEQTLKTVTLTKGYDGYFYTGANQFPRGRYDVEIYYKTESNPDTFQRYDPATGRIDLRDTIASQAEISAGGVVAVSPLTTYAYDAHGNRVQQTRHAAGAQGGFTDTDFSVERLSNDQTSYWRYNAMGTVRQSQNAEQDSEYYSYDAAGNLRKTWQRVTVNNQYGGTSSGTLTQIHGNVIGYDRVGQITRQIQLRPNLDIIGQEQIKHTETTLEFNGFGEMTARGQGGVLQEYFDYDNAGRLIRTNQDSGVDRMYFYDRQGRMRTEMVNNGSNNGTVNEVDLRVADGLVRLGDTSVALGSDAMDGLLGLASTRTNRVDFTLDQLGRVIEKRSAGLVQDNGDNAQVQTQDLDRWNNVIQVDDSDLLTPSDFVRTEYRYNSLNKLITANEATTSGLSSWQQASTASLSDETAAYRVRLEQTGFITQHYYDDQGRKIGSTDANGESQGLLLNSDGQATREMEADGWVSSVGYDAFGNIRESRNAKNALSYMVYDRNNRMVKNFAPKGEVQYAYNERGHRVETKRLYDIEIPGDETSKQWITTEEVYDALGNVIYKKEGGIESGAGYDQYGRKNYEWRGVSSYSGQITYSQTWAQDYFGLHVSDSNGSKNVDFGGREIFYTYNNANQQLTQVADRAISGASGTQNLTYRYYENGWVKSITDNAMGLTTTYQYDAKGNKTQERAEYVGYDNGGSNLVGSQTTTTTYDALGRVARVIIDATGDLQDSNAERNYGVDLTYNYDAVGNRRAVIQNGDEANANNLWYAYDASNRLILSQGTASIIGADKDLTIAETENGVLISYDAAGNRESSVRRVEGSNGITKTVIENFYYDANNLHTMTTLGGGLENNGNAIVQKRYDLAGRVEYQLNYSFKEDGYEKAGSAASGLTRYLYVRGSDRMLSQYAYDAGDLTSILDGDIDMQGRNRRSTVSDFDYDDAGVLKANATGIDGDGTNNSTITLYAYSHLLGREIVQRSETETKDGQSGSLQTHFDANGNQIRITDTEGDQNRTFILNSSGQIIRKYQGSNLQNYFYNGNQGIASSGLVDGLDLDYNFTPLSDQTGLSAPSRYTVAGGGETLGSVAAAVWGDASLWYLIADANGLSAGANLAQGQTLTIPNRVSNVHNTADTFKPYNPADIIGDLSPTVPVPEGPDAGCNSGAIMVQVLAVIIAIIIIVVSGTTMSPQAMMLVFAASNLAAQYIGTKVGLIEEIDYTAVAVAAISGYFGGMAPAVTVGDSAVKVFLTYAAQGAAQAAANYGVRKALGEDVKFSWTTIATSAIVSGISGSLDLNAGENAGIGASVLSSVGNAALSNVVSSAITGDNEGVEWAQVAINAFGQAIVGQVSGKLGHKEGGLKKGDYRLDLMGAAGRTEDLVAIVSRFAMSGAVQAKEYMSQAIDSWGQSVGRGSTNGTNKYALDVSQDGNLL